ncbi:MAG: GntR family transcriptional regulator [Lentisphaeria bacterium]
MHPFNPISGSRRPRHLAVYDYLAGKLKSNECQAGDRLETDAELAAKFKISRQTVLRAIQQLQTEKRIVRHQGKGTFVSTPPATAPSPAAARRTVGLVAANLADSLGHQVALGAEAALRRRGYDLVLCNSNYDILSEAAHLRRLKSHGVAGVLLIPYLPPHNEALVKQMMQDANTPTPVVCIDIGFKKLAPPLITADNYQAAYDAVNYLISLGHQRIAFIVNTIDRIDTVQTIRERYQGYRRALADHGLPFDRELIQEVGAKFSAMRPRDVGLEAYGYEPMHKLLCLKAPPTAVFLLWDELAPGAMNAVINSGLRVPQDVSFVSFNDDDFAAFLPAPLTTLRQPGEAMGREAATLVMDLAEGKPNLVTQHRLPAKLILRSSACPPGGNDAVAALENCFPASA